MMTKQTEDVPWWRNHPWLGRHLAIENRNNFPPEELLKYNHKHVAWFPDGSGIRDADKDREVLVERLRAAGDDLSWYTYEYIDLDPYL
jgi:hypothetical protein